jgi:glycosyltransferase involved in cell wall biosynthesis
LTILRDRSISVIIPTFNRAHLLRRAIDGVLNQTFENFEMIIVDDGSTDNTEEVIKSISVDRIRYFKQSNQGRSAARNVGVSLAQSSVIIFLDSDDEVRVDWLKEMIQPFEDPTSGIVCCGRTVIENRPHIANNRIFEELPKRMSATYEAQSALFLPGTFALRRDLFTGVGGYNPDLAYGENAELALRLLPYCLQGSLKVVSIPKTLVIFHTQRPFGSALDFENRLKSAEYILNRHGERYRTTNRPGFANYCAIAGVNAARLGRYGQSVRHFFKAICVDPLRWKHYVRFFLALFPPLGRKFWLRYKDTIAS